MHYVVFPFNLIETDWKTAGNCSWAVLNWYSCIFKLTEAKAKYQSLWFFSSIWMLLFDVQQSLSPFSVLYTRGQKITELLLLSEKFANFNWDGHKSKLNSDSTNNLRWMYFVTIQIHVSQFSQLWGPIFSCQPHTQGIFPNSIGR